MNRALSDREARMPHAKRRRSRYQGIAVTRLEIFIRSRGLFTGKIAQASGVGRVQLQLWRTGKAWPMLTSIRNLVRGIREVTNDPKVKANDLFALDDDE